MKPIGLKWRSSVAYSTFVVGLGIAGDLLVYSIIIPIIPFRLENLGYKHPSTLTGYLIFAYSCALVASTIPIAILSEKYTMRRFPMLLGLVALIGAQVLLMLATHYWVMIIARMLQGISSAVIWVVGLAMLCDATPKQHIGRQLGIAIAGLTIGLSAGPPIGGVLYGRLGYHPPFLFSIGFTVLDFISRLIVIERGEALKYGHDPTAAYEADAEKNMPTEERPKLSASGPTVSQKVDSEKPVENKAAEKRPAFGARSAGPSGEPDRDDDILPPLPPAEEVDPPERSLLSVMGVLLTSSRALVAMVITFTYGIVYTAQEPTMPLRLQALFHLDPTQVGLIFLSGIVPTLFASPLTGWLTDLIGPEWVCFTCLAVSLPWWPIVMVHNPLGAFIFTFAIICFSTSGVVSPVTAELAAVARGIEGVGYAHVYAAFNIAYGVGTAAGPILGGEIYGGLRHGWIALCLASIAILALTLLLSFLYLGEDPLVLRLIRYRERRSHREPPVSYPPTPEPQPDPTNAIQEISIS